MRDLKHLIFFENLLQEANNDLVKQARNEGKRAIGYTCYFMPEVLLDLPGCFSVRLRAPRSSSPEMATYYMSNRTCHYGRSLMERALEGGFNFLDAQMATETCTVTCRFQEHLGKMDIIQNPNFFVEFTDVPFKKTENSFVHYRRQLQAHVLDPLREKFGVDTSDEAILKAIEQHNEVCRLITEIGAYRKLDNPTITGYEFAVICLATYCCPKDLLLPLLRETAEANGVTLSEPRDYWRGSDGQRRFYGIPAAQIPVLNSLIIPDGNTYYLCMRVDNGNQTTARQMLLIELLGGTPPSYCHAPLLIAPEGRKLSKRDGDLSTEGLRARYTPEQLTGKLAKLAGLRETDEPVHAWELVKDFSWSKVPTEPIIIDDSI